MTHPESDAEVIADDRHNVARFFTYHRPIAWIILLGVTLWGIYGYVSMPKRKDPEIPIRLAQATCPWPGVSAEKVEQLVTRQIEAQIAQNSRIRPPEPGEYGIKSVSLPGLAVVQVQLSEDVTDTRREFNDIALKLNALNAQLPDGAGPIYFNSDFGDTAALMLTVASPVQSATFVTLRARAVEQAIRAAREGRAAGGEKRLAVVMVVPEGLGPALSGRLRALLARHLVDRGLARDVRLIQGTGFVGLDAASAVDEGALLAAVREYGRDRLGLSSFHPDAWSPVVIGAPEDTERALRAVAGPRYTYRELDDFTDLIRRRLQQVPEVAVVRRSGVLAEQVFLEYSQAQLASYGVQPSSIARILTARNTALSGGMISVDQTDVLVDPSGEFKGQRDIGEVIIATDANGNAVYLRDTVEVVRGYESPPSFLNDYHWKDAEGRWHRSPAVTLAVQMRAGQQIADFARHVDAAMAGLRSQLPPDLIIARTSDQPRQVRENIALFMDALWEALILVVLVAFVGFWEWRLAVLMALSIPITLCMTFGVIHMLGIELQQVSIATLIIALGLLVDDPVVAGDAIKRDLGAGHSRLVAAWLGPTKISKAILFATITNIVAYLPFLLLTGTTGEFLRALPIVMTCALVASRLVSMTFVPLLGYYLLRPPRRLDPPIAERRHRGLTGVYYRVGVLVLEHRWTSLVASLGVIALGVVLLKYLPTQFFPLDQQYLSYVDLWLPNNVALARTEEVASQAVRVVQDVAAEYGREHPGPDGRPADVLKSVTTFVGGGGPRFWYSLSPEQRQKNYAQLVIELTDKEITSAFIDRLQRVLAERVDGARADARELEINVVGVPIQIQVTGGSETDASRSPAEIAKLRELAARVADVIRAVPIATGVRDDWDAESFVVKLRVDPDRANMAGVTNQDVAASAGAGISGAQVGVLREGDRQIPIVVRLRLEERARLADVESLYVYAANSARKAPLGMVATVDYAMETQRIRRFDHFRTITVLAFPVSGAYASQVMKAAQPGLDAIARDLPPGYQIKVVGSAARQKKGFGQLGLVMAVSIGLIYLALVLQFNDAVKPILVFAAVPYGIAGAVAGLWIMGEPFGFMGFLGIASLVGVIVSHVIVLFDFIEENHAKGEPLVDSLLDAGIVRLRPVMITVMATVLGLVPLALHGGPLWRPLCYAQIGGLALATFIELLLVKVFYVIFVEDLRIVKWEGALRSPVGPADPATPPGTTALVAGGDGQ